MIRKRINKCLATALIAGLGLNILTNSNIFEVSASSFKQIKSSNYAGGTGTEADPYLISTPEHLNQLRLDILDGVDITNKYFKLTNDIDLSDFDTDEDVENGNWTPFSPYETQFKGVLDGSDFSISNITINLPTTRDVGFFGYIGIDGVVKNLHLKNLDATASYSAGGFVSKNYGMVINSSVQGNLTTTSGNVAGFVAGNYEGSIVNSSSDMNLNATGSSGGGFAGVNRGSISNSIAKGTLTATEYAGGFIRDGDDGVIENCIASVKVNSPSKSGGFSAQNGLYIDSYWNKEVSGQENYAGVTTLYPSNIFELTTAQMQGENAKVNMPLLDFENTWTAVDGDYPSITGKYILKKKGVEPYSGGTGTVDDPYLISNAKQLAYLAKQVNTDNFDTTDKHYKLSNDIDFANYDSDNEVLNGNYRPIASSKGISFKGTFDGNNKVIKNLEIKDYFSDYANAGLFGTIESATIKNVGLENCEIYASGRGNDGNGTTLGGLVGHALAPAKDDNYKNIIQNSFVKGTVAGINIGNNGNVITGGLVGKGSSINIDNSYSQGNLIGYTTQYNSKDRLWSGGIIGYAQGAESKEPANNNGMLLNKVYSSMNITGYSEGNSVNDNGKMASLIGYSLGGGKLQNSYWDKEATNFTKSSNIGSSSLYKPLTYVDIYGLTTSQMHGENAKINMSLLDFNNTWVTNENDYPSFKAQAKSPSLKPTVSKMEDGKIELIDNNPQNERGELYYRINNSLTKANDWTLYTAPFMPVYDENGNFSLEVKSINTFGLESEVESFNENKTNVLSVNKDLSVNVSAENSLEMNLSTNEINFSNYNGTQDFENNDLIVTISSGLPYDLDAILTKDLTDETDETNKIPSNLLGVKITNNPEYQFFTQEGDKKNLVSNSPIGKNVEHGINIKLKGDSSIKPAEYHGVINFEATQK